METTDITEIRKRIKEFAEAVDKAHKDFLDSNCHNKEGARLFPTICSDSQMYDWIKSNNEIEGREKISKETHFIPIRNEGEFVAFMDFKGNFLSLQD